LRRAVAVLCCLAGVGLRAQPAPPPIAIDVVVDGGAAPHPMLSAGDFSVTEAGAPVPVRLARLVQAASDTTPLPSIGSDEDERTAAAMADRLVGIYVDEYHLEDDAAFAAARDALASFVRSSLGPRDLIVVVKPLDPLVSLRLTTDREAAAQVVDDARPRQSDYTPRSSFEQEFIAGATARIDAARNQIAWSGISAVTQHLGRFASGRKTLIVLSNGISRVTPSRGDGPLPGVDSIVRAANRARVAIYPIRPSPASPGAVVTQSVSGRRPAPGDPLETLATQTTGVVIDAGDIAAGLRRVLRDASSYYVLTLEPDSPSPDGRLRPVTVAVSSRRPDLVLRARSAYATPRPDDDPMPRPSALPAGLKIPRHASPLIRTWFGQTAEEGGQTTVAFVWEPAPRVPGVRAPSILPARVSMTVSRMDGTPVYTGTSGPSGRETGMAPADRAQLTFSTEPGALLVQMDVLDPAGRVIDRDVRDLAVTAFRSPLALGSPSVYRSRTQRELRAILEGTSSAAPVASRQFSRAEHLVVSVPVMATADDQPTVTVRLQSRFGSPLRDLHVSSSTVRPGAVQVDLPLAPLASGGYLLEFAARSARGSVTERLEFVVTP
jgi:VWFA-related protein